jgi:hypothetical protein
LAPQTVTVKGEDSFFYLIELDGIKVEKERFTKGLQDIEQYLNNGDWTLAEYWVKRIMTDYEDVILSIFRSEEKDVSAREADNIEEKQNYQDLGIY